MSLHKAQRLSDPIPLRLGRKQLAETRRAVELSGLKQPDVLRRAIDAGLPHVMRRFANVNGNGKGQQ